VVITQLNCAIYLRFTPTCWLQSSHGLLLKPQPGAFKNNLLRSLDILPPGSVRIGACSINEEPYTDFDAGSWFKLPDTNKWKSKFKLSLISEPSRGKKINIKTMQLAVEAAVNVRQFHLQSKRDQRHKQPATVMKKWRRCGRLHLWFKSRFATSPARKQDDSGYD